MTLQPSPDDFSLPGGRPSEPANPSDADFESVLMEGLSEPVSASSADAGWADLPDLSPPSPGASTEPEADDGEPATDEADMDLESMLLGGLSDAPSVSSEDADAPAPEPEDEPGPEPESAAPEPGESPAGLDTDFEDALLAGLSGEAALSPGNGDASESPAPGIPPDPPPDAGSEEGPQDFRADFRSEDPPEIGHPDASSMDFGDPLTSLPPVSSIGEAVPEPVFDPNPPEAGDLPAPEVGAPAGDFLPGAAPDRPVAALAFAADPETETALRQGLLRFEDSWPDREDPQVWPGGLRAAVAALADGNATGLVIVDIDGIAYPAGAMHELAEVCEVGTAVIAVGSDDSARTSREILLAGVSDYLVKPVAPAALREAALRAAAGARGSRDRGCVAGFAGTGGSGATTLAAATALHAAGQGRYVSILDLNRSVSPIGLLLDVEPAPGLDQVFEVAGRSPPDPKLLDGVRAERSERISVYAYRPGSALPPVPSIPALDWLLDQLRQRSQLVLVDGLDDPATGFDLLDELDLRVAVVEPTVSGAARAARMVDLLGRTAQVLLVQNHTRAFRTAAGTRLLEDAGIAVSPDAVVPFDRSLPEIAGRGWPRGRLPRGLGKPVAALAALPFPPAPRAPGPPAGRRRGPLSRRPAAGRWPRSPPSCPCRGPACRARPRRRPDHGRASFRAAVPRRGRNAGE